MKNRLIAIVVCNNFYVSCERLFKPSYENRPVIILSNNDGCVIARSEEAKALGIAMGIPYLKCKEVCEQNEVIVHSSNFELYGDISKRVILTLANFITDIEVYSIDEAFLDLSGIPNPYDYCIMLREKILKWTGISTSIGIGSTKTLAKIASKNAKVTEEGVYEIDNYNLDKILYHLPINKIWGIGKKWSAQLEKKLRIKTAYDLKHSSPSFIREHLSVIGERIVYELRGMSCLEFGGFDTKKAIACSKSFSKKVETFEYLKEAIATYTATGAKKLRKQNSKAYAIYIHIKTDRYDGSKQYMNGKLVELIYPTSDTRTLILAAIKGLERIFKLGYAYKKVGIVLLDITSAKSIQADILKPCDQEFKKKALNFMQTMDNLNKKFGKSVVQYAAEGINKAWKTKAERLSPSYNSCWKNLLTVS